MQDLAERMGVKFKKVVYLMTQAGATTLINEGDDLSSFRKIEADSQIEADEAELTMMEFNSSRYFKFVAPQPVYI